MTAYSMHGYVYKIVRHSCRFSLNHFSCLFNHQLTHLSLLLFIIIVFLPPAIATEQHILSEIKKVSFSNPSYTVRLPEEWQDKGIKHQASFGKVDIAIALNQQILPFTAPFIYDYAKEKGITVKIVSTTCGTAAGYMSRKEVDIASFCCPPGKIDRLPGIKFHTLGIHPVIFLVNPSNPIDDISLGNLRRVFQGEIVSWSEIGGSKNNINVAGPLHCKKRPGHWKLLLPHENYFSPNFFDIGMDDTVRQPASDKSMISYASILTTQNVWKDVAIIKNGTTVKALKINGFSPEEKASLLSGDYPIYRVFNLTTWEGAHIENRHARDLVNYLIEKITIKDDYVMVPAGELRKAGWKFKGDELIGEPEHFMR